MTRGGVRREFLYMNYDEPEELHDYSFLGDDFRERERISKKIQRHVNKLSKLPLLERKAIVKAITSGNINSNSDTSSGSTIHSDGRVLGTASPKHMMMDPFKSKQFHWRK